jgi:hypothetical protein
VTVLLKGFPLSQREQLSAAIRSRERPLQPPGRRSGVGLSTVSLSWLEPNAQAIGTITVTMYLLLCIVSLLAGYGILAVLGLTIGRAQQWLLAPGICLAGWAIALGIGVSLGIPVRHLALPFWVVTAIAAAYGAWRARAGVTWEAGSPLLLVLALPGGVMVFDFWQGLGNFVGGPAPDGWSYVARGQQLWEMSKDATGNFAPLYQYASHLHLTRFIASALLAAFSPVTGAPGDTQVVAGPFIAWSLFVFGASCASIGLAHYVKQPWLLIFCTLAVASRWTFGAVHVHNYDNLIAISFLPMMMGLVAGVTTVSWRAVIALGGLLAAMVYAYPEMAAFAGLGATASAAKRAFDERSLRIVNVMGAAVVFAAVLILPAWRDLSWFLSNQIAAATMAHGLRAGEGSFAELASIANWGTAVWGLDSRAASLRLGITWELLRHALAACLWLLACVGCVRLIRQRRWDLAAVGGVLLCGALFMAVREQYSYGTYKFVLLAWWLIALCVAIGAQGIVEAAEERPAATRAPRTAAAILVTLPLVALLGSVAGRIVVVWQSTANGIQPYRALLDIDRVIGSEPLIVAVDDDVANAWAVYFLRSRAIRLMTYRSYMSFAHVVPLMKQAAAPDPQAVKYVLSDKLSSPPPNVVWNRGAYTLWRIPTSGTAFLRQVMNPNGAERINGHSYYWIGQGDTELDVFATSAGEATFSGRFVLGPSLPDRPGRRLLIVAAGETERPVTITQGGDQSFSFPLRAGENRIAIRPLDRPTVAVTGGGDTRPLLLGVEGLNVSMVRD